VHDRDSLRRFIFEGYPIRGHLVHLDASWRALIEHQDHPRAIREALGEAVVASLLLAATIKFEGVLSLQLRGSGPLQLLLAQCTSGLGVRGLARCRGATTAGATTEGPGSAGAASTGAASAAVGSAADAIGPAATSAEATGAAASGDLPTLIGGGNLTVTLESDDGSQRYQGIVPITGASLADSLQLYFENSEQLPTRLWLQADEHGAAGMLLQRLPDGGGAAAGIAAADPAAVEDAWRRVQLIGATLTPEELRGLADAEIVHRLFNEDDVRIFEPAPVFFRCRCSRDRVGGMLQGLGEAETRSILAERGEVEVRCDFCNRAYVFDAVDVGRLFIPGVAGDAGSRVH
jgi:molecular chaperone Hsp33